MVSDVASYLNKLAEIQNSNINTIYTQYPVEPRLIIDSNTRKIIVPPALTNIGVVNDHNVETIYFEIDRFFDNEDLNDHICVIQYINANNEEDIYVVTKKDITIEGKLIFGWTISNYVTKTKGDVKFAVRFYTLQQVNGVTSFKFNFNTVTGSFKILDGLNLVSTQIEANSNSFVLLFDQLNTAIENTSSVISSANDVIDTANEKITLMDGAIESVNNAVIATKNANDAAVNAQNTAKNLETTYAPRLTNAESQLVQISSQKANISYVDTKIASVTSGSPKNTFATLSLLQEDSTANTTEGKKSIYVVTADGNWYYWNGSAWVSGGVYQATQSSEFAATNIVPNSDFSSGTTSGWSALSSTNSVTNKVLTNTANGTASYGLVKNDLTNLVVGHKYYFRGKAKVTNVNSTYLRLKVNYSTELQYTINNPVANTVYDISGIFTATATTSALNFMHGYADATTANSKSMELQYVLGIDLTNIFGSGNEPILLEVDTLMLNYVNSWFSGTVAPFTDNKELYNRVYKLKNSTLAGRTILGTANQINVINGDGASGNPIIDIPEGATGIFRPATTSVNYGVELSPAIATWTGESGATWNGSAWLIPAKGTVKANVEVEKDAEYQINITWTDTNSYDTILVDPKMIVKLGTTVSEPQFTGYSDALYALTLIAGESGTVELKLGDGIEDWSATISNVSIKKVTAKVTKAGKIGVGSFDIYTGGTNFAIGAGHSKRTTGDSNNALGYQAQNELTAGKYNNAIGTYAQQSITTGLNNNALGHGAQRYLKSGYYNIGIGYSAQSKLESGSWNVGIGNECQRDMTTGDMNTSIGSRAHNAITTGSCNVAIGRHAGYYPKGANNPTTTANFQTTIGTQSGQSSNTQADNLTTIGCRAIGTTNATAIGANTEANHVGSVAIGMDSDGTGANVSEQNEFALGTSLHKVKVKGTLNIARYTPSGTADTMGQIGDITTDDNYIYVKTSAGWKRSALSTW